jgi:hypothetical protein
MSAVPGEWFVFMVTPCWFLWGNVLLKEELKQSFLIINL